MPHIIVEYSDMLESSVDVPKMLSELHDNLAQRETITIRSIKTRAIPVKYTLAGDQNDHDKMVHITLKLLPGRDADLLREMTQGLYDAVRKHLHKDDISLSCESVILDQETYIK